jgi:hypothetical protein
LGEGLQLQQVGVPQWVVLLVLQLVLLEQLAEGLVLLQGSPG